MSHARRRELPDPDAARREISETVQAVGPVIAKQARAHAQDVHQFLERGRVRGRAREREARTLLHTIYRALDGAWLSNMQRYLKWFYSHDDPKSLFLGPIYTAFQPMNEALGQDHREFYTMRADELTPTLSLLRRCLMTLADSPPESIPCPAPIPAQHPPKYARLSEAAFVEQVTDQLAACIDECFNLYKAARWGDWSGPLPVSPRTGGDPVLDDRFTAVLRPFQPEVVSGYITAITGHKTYPNLLIWGTGLWDPERFPEDREVSDRLCRRVYSAYAAIAVNYLVEVQELMPRYLELSEREKGRDPVTVYGNVGAINSAVNNSNLSVADTVTNIGMTIEAVAGRGDADLAAAIRALIEAIQHAPELADDQRAELLDNVADVADGAAAPDEPHRLRRAKNAMAMITSAAGASTQLAQAVETWHQVAGKLF